MNKFTETCVLINSLFLVYSGIISGIHSLSYDYSATTECLFKPHKPHHAGGIIVNPEFRQNIDGWSVSGQAKIKEGISKDGNRFIIAYNRSGSLDSISQRVRFAKRKLYSFSAWVQISEGNETVTAMFRKDDGGLIRGGDIVAKHGCWSLLKGGLVSDFSGLVDILFQCKNKTVEIWIDNVSLREFTMKQWRSHQDKSIDKVRKTKFGLQVTYANKTALKGAKISIKQTKSNFPFGCGMNHNILTSTDYQNWFASRFKFTTFTNEMKWYSTEIVEGKENYTIADAMLRFAKNKGINVRGHNILWDDPNEQPLWVKNLTPAELKKAAIRRINSITGRYSRQLIGWDVVNENLHFRFFESKLGELSSAEFYARAYSMDPQTTMFMNEFNTIEYSGDETAKPVHYVAKLKEILSYPGNKGMLAGIGLQGHFVSGQPNLVHMRSSLDFLGSTKLPIWLTEVSLDKGTNQEKYLEEVLREGYSHPAVQGIVMFAGPIMAGFKGTTLADENFKNTPAGDVVDKLIAEWRTGNLEVVTDDKGLVQVSLFHGDYEFTVKHPDSNIALTTSTYKAKADKLKQTFNLNIAE